MATGRYYQLQLRIKVQTSENKAARCPECGAPLTSEDSCAPRFYNFLALEMSDPEFGGFII